MIRRMLAIAAIAGVAFGCAPGVPTPTATPTSAVSLPAFPAVLNVDGRGNPPVVIDIGALDVAHLSCSDGLILTPGTAGVPPLPWDLRVTDGSDGRVLLATHVDELPKWLLLMGDEASIGSIPVAGPSGPPCASAAA